MCIEERIREFGRNQLVGRGFQQVTPWAFERACSGLVQGVGFVPGSGGLDGTFTVDVYLRYTTSRRTVRAMDCHCRIGEFMSGRDEWFAVADEQSYAKIAEVLQTSVEPFFLSLSSVEAVLRALEQGRYSDRKLFGLDPGWRLFNMGFCYLWAGNAQKAMQYLTDVVEKHSAAKHAWVAERQAIATEGLKEARTGTPTR